MRPVLILAAALLAPFALLGIVLAAFWPTIGDASGFMPRTMCGKDWTIELISLHVYSDVLIFISYMVLSLALLIFYYKLRPSFSGLQFSVIVWTWAMFVMACGFTHISNRLMFSYPAYRFDGVVRAVCAAVSVAAVLQLPFAFYRYGGTGIDESRR